MEISHCGHSSSVGKASCLLLNREGATDASLIPSRVMRLFENIKILAEPLFRIKEGGILEEPNISKLSPKISTGLYYYNIYGT